MATPKDYDGKTELFSISFRMNGFTTKTFKVMKKRQTRMEHLTICL